MHLPFLIKFILIFALIGALLMFLFGNHTPKDALKGAAIGFFASIYLAIQIMLLGLALGFGLWFLSHLF
jgi:hypothetical protein